MKTAFGSRIIFVLQSIWCTTALVIGWDPINPIMYTTFYASTLIRGRVICDRDIVSYSIVNTSISPFIANQLTRIRFTYNSNPNKYKVCGKGTTAASLRHSFYTYTSSDDANVFDDVAIAVIFASMFLNKPHAIKHVVRFEQRRPVTLLIDINDRCPSLHQSDIVQEIQHDDSNNVPAPVNLLLRYTGNNGIDIPGRTLHGARECTLSSRTTSAQHRSTVTATSRRYRHELHRRKRDQPLQLPHDVVVANSAHRQHDSDKRIGRSLIHYRIYVHRV